MKPNSLNYTVIEFYMISFCTYSYTGAGDGVLGIYSLLFGGFTITLYLFAVGAWAANIPFLPITSE